MAEAVLLREDRDEVRVLTLNRPRALNALNGGLILALHDALAAAPTPAVVVITGAGDNFCAGGDRREGIAVNGEMRKGLHLLQAITALLRRPEVVSVAAVNGWVVGGGFELAIACDFVVAGTTARFRMPDAQVGAHATGGATWLLPRTVGLHRANALMLGGLTLDAGAAKSWGLVVEAVDPDQTVTRALEFAHTLSHIPRTSMIESKRSLALGLDGDLADALRREVTVTEPLLTDETFRRFPGPSSDGITALEPPS